MGYKINYFGWNNEPGHDKVWGYLTIGEGVTAELFNFWGARGKKLSFKKHETNYFSVDELRRLAQKKTGKGYREIPTGDIETVVEGFHEQLELQLTLAKLFENYRGKKDEEVEE